MPMSTSFQRGSADDDGYLPAARSDAVRPRRTTLAGVEGRPVILTRLGGKLIAFSAICPHALGDLSRSPIDNGQTDCPQHGWRFAWAAENPFTPKKMDAACGSTP